MARRVVTLDQFDTATMAWRIELVDMRRRGASEHDRDFGVTVYGCGIVRVCAAQPNLSLVCAVYHEIGHAQFYDSPAYDPTEAGKDPEESCVTKHENLTRQLIYRGLLVPKWRDRQLDAARRQVLGAEARQFETTERLAPPSSSGSSVTLTSGRSTAGGRTFASTSRAVPKRARR